MALQVWLPLNKEGDFKNKGLADITVTNNGASYNSNGKIGGCYSFDGNDVMQFTPTSTFRTIIDGSFSIGCWFKSSELASGQSAGGLIAVTFGCSIFLNSGGELVFRTDNGSNLAAISTSETYFDSKWHCVYGTYDNTTYKTILYVDGIEKISTTRLISNRYSNWVGIGQETNNNIYHLNGQINDVRIYDHCLSPKEVKEISKGLVLHYPLNNNFYNPNLLKLTFGIGNADGSDGKAELYTCDGIQGIRITRTTTSSWGTFICVPVKDTSKLLTNTKYTFSVYAKILDSSKSTNSITNFIASANSNNTLIQGTEKTISDLMLLYTWENVSDTGTYDSSGNLASYGWHLPIYGSGSCDIWVSFPKLEFGGNFTGFSDYDNSIVYDCSGYENNGTITGTLTTSTDTPRYDKCTYISTNKITTPNLGLTAPYTLSYWLKATDTTNFTTNYLVLRWGDMFIYRDHNNFYLYSLLSSGTIIDSSAKDIWNHIVVTDDGTTIKGYCNGILNCSRVHTTSVNEVLLGPGYNDFYASDFRIYATALSATDIQELYNTSAFITDNGTVETYLFEESPNLVNMLKTEQEGITTKSWKGGLTYTQVGNNIAMSLTDTGYRIYRTANNSATPGGGTGQSRNWGGLCIQNSSNRYNFIKGHTYLIEFDIKGISDRSAGDVEWSNQTGWGGGGLYPSPSNVVICNPVTSSFNSDLWQHFSYKWTINDDVYKTCTSSYSGFVKGTSYVSYRDFKFGWNYTSTGELGTDVYINNLRMYDITTETPIQLQIEKSGEILTTAVVENNNNAFIDSYGEINSNQLIEI